jgi:hypothetical protein
MRYFYRTVEVRDEICNAECAHCHNPSSIPDTEFVVRAEGVLWCMGCVDADHALLEALDLEKKFVYDPYDRHRYFWWLSSDAVKKIKTIPRSNPNHVMPQAILMIEE